jgi:hypothetical protein
LPVPVGHEAGAHVSWPPSDSATKPGAQRTVHPPSTHSAVALAIAVVHAAPHAPQSLSVVVRSVSQPFALD